MLKFAIIGVGSLGKVHLKNTLKLEKTRTDIQLTALCDVDETRFREETATNLDVDTALPDISGRRLYTDVNELLEKEPLDFVITALPTYLHEEIAGKALERGLHVFSEKPMALELAQCKKMICKAKEHQKLLMIGQCLRYWPEYVRLKEYIDSMEFGKVIRAEFSRYSPTPAWSWQNWLLDAEKSGGAALDMHVHDVDFIQWAFGKPISVSSHATHVKSKFDSIFTTYGYKDKLITSACDWSLPAKYPFSPAFLVRFETAAAVMDNCGMKVYTEDGEVFAPTLDSESAYVSEINDFIDCILSKSTPSVITLESVKQTMEIALAEMESAAKGIVINL